jgi:alpha-amylase/alpha-mannosidase (GH57 family)
VLNRADPDQKGETMIYWAQLFHFYQPATQLLSVLDKICNESYRSLMQVLRTVDNVYQVEHDGHRLAVFFRDDLLSNKISFQQVGSKEFLEHLNALKGDREDIYVVTAMDAETYGHHIKNWEELFLC